MLTFFSTYDSHSNDDIVECLQTGQSFFFIHGNIRSPSVNFDNLYDKLCEVYFLLSLFALTGTKIMLDKNLQSLEHLFTSISLFHSLPILTLVFLPVMFLIAKVLKSYLTSINQLMCLKSFGLKCRILATLIFSVV